MTPAEFRAWRERVGLTQAQAAAWFGVSRMTIIRWETKALHLTRQAELACEQIERKLKALRGEQ